MGICRNDTDNRGGRTFPAVCWNLCFRGTYSGEELTSTVTLTRSRSSRTQSLSRTRLHSSLQGWLGSSQLLVRSFSGLRYGRVNDCQNGPALRISWQFSFLFSPLRSSASSSGFLVGCYS